jgi:hypothetical protein
MYEIEEKKITRFAVGGREFDKREEAESYKVFLTLSDFIEGCEDIYLSSDSSSAQDIASVLITNAPKVRDLLTAICPGTYFHFYTRTEFFQGNLAKMVRFIDRLSELGAKQLEVPNIEGMVYDKNLTPVNPFLFKYVGVSKGGATMFSEDANNFADPENPSAGVFLNQDELASQAWAKYLGD